MKKVINIHDNIQIDDDHKLKGIIRIYDKNQKLIAETHNMIVFSGRQLFFRLFCSGFAFFANSASASTNNLQLYINFGYLGEARVTEQNSTYNDFFNSAHSPIKTILINESNCSIQGLDENAGQDSTNTTLALTITVSISGSSEFQKFDEIGLSFTDALSQNHVLFSRAPMDPVFLGADGKYTLKYSIYC